MEDNSIYVYERTQNFTKKLPLCIKNGRVLRNFTKTQQLNRSLRLKPLIWPHCEQKIVCTNNIKSAEQELLQNQIHLPTPRRLEV